MHNGKDLERKVGAWRRELYAELCGEVFGCERGGAEAFERYEGTAGGNVKGKSVLDEMVRGRG